jgi:hypothetical protein
MGASRSRSNSVKQTARFSDTSRAGSSAWSTDRLFMEALQGFFERQVAVERARLISERMSRLSSAF